MKINKEQGWFSIRHAGREYRGPKGPFPSRELAETALENWRERTREYAGTIEASGSVRVQGPFKNRAEARKNCGAY